MKFCENELQGPATLLFSLAASRLPPLCSCAISGTCIIILILAPQHWLHSPDDIIPCNAFFGAHWNRVLRSITLARFQAPIQIQTQILYLCAWLCYGRIRVANSLLPPLLPSIIHQHHAENRMECSSRRSIAELPGEQVTPAKVEVR